MEYSIGDFSKISRLGIKTLRYYHEIGLLIPSRIDKFTSYRYYEEKCLSRVETINRFKELGFSLETIKEILQNYKEDQDLVEFMQSRLADVSSKIEEYREIRDKIDSFLRLKAIVPVPIGEPQIKEVPNQFIASIQFKGKYSDIDEHMTRLNGIFSTVVNGPAFCLYHDEHHAEETMNIECCLPIRKKMPAARINYHTLKGGRMISITHEGDYSSIWKAYQKIVDYLNKRDFPILPPTREIYLRGKGNFLPGDPENYLTEIQFILKEDEDPISKTIRTKASFNIHA